MGSARRVSDLLRVDRLDNGRRELVRDLVIDLGVNLNLPADESYPGFALADTGTTWITVPAGFDTDFSSIPALARALYRFASVDLAGCCHDYAYRVGVPREPADEVWRLVAISGETRIGALRGWFGWLGLRLGGGIAYYNAWQRRRKHRARTLSDAPPA